MNKGTLTTLDFVISVLREHEKEMTSLSEKLEDAINRMSNNSEEKDTTDVHAVLKDLEEKVSSIEGFLGELLKQTANQNENLSLMIKAMANYPTRMELEDLRESISAFDNLIRKIVSSEVPKSSRY